MPNRPVDRDVILGLLALHFDFITRSALIAAIEARSLEEDRPIAEILVEGMSLDPTLRALLEPLVDAHVARYGGDPTLSLASLVSAGDFDTELLSTAAGISSERTAEWQHNPGAVDDPRHLTSPAGFRYRQIRKHDQGGLGVVFLAWDEELKREVALKEIKASIADNDEVRARFLREAEVTGRLEHPGVVPVYGLGTYRDGRPFYAMRFIQGESLKKSITDFHSAPDSRSHSGARTLALQKLLRRFLDVCNVIAYAHSRGVLHRDIKPDNVMVGRFGETLLVDWGLAKPTGPIGEKGRPIDLADDEAEVSGIHTSPGALLGTPAFMSPEQASGDLDRMGPASDIYSLGATLYNILTGRTPFQGANIVATLDRARRGDFPRPRLIDPTADPALEAVCLKAMSREPGGRYATARALAEDLERWLADEPVSARREPVPVRLGRWARRHRTSIVGATSLVMATATTLMITAGLIAASAVKEKDANEKSRRALEQKAREQGIATLQIGRAESRLRRLIEINGHLARSSVGDLAGQRKDRLESLDLALKYARETARELEQDRGTRQSRADPEGSHNRSIQIGLLSGPENEIQRLIASLDREIGEVQVQLGRFDDALPSLRAKVAEAELGLQGLRGADRFFYKQQAEPKLVEDIVQLGRVLVASGELLEASKYCDRAIAIQRRTDLVDGSDFAFGRLGGNRPDFRDYLLAGRERGAQRSIGLAILLHDLGREKEATEFFRSGRAILEMILRVDPERTADRLSLAWLLANCPVASVADPTLAAKLASGVIDSGKVSASALFVLGASLEEASRHEEAIAATRRALRLHSEQDGRNLEGWLILSLAEARRGRADEARKWYDLASRWIETNGCRTFEARTLQARATDLLGR